MRVKLLLSLMFLFFVIASKGQSGGYEAGYLVLNSDTVQGFIERTDEVSLSRAVNFKSDVTGGSKTYFPGDITAFGFKESGVVFEPVQVDVGREKVKRTNRFAKLMLRGDLSLYFLELDDNEIERIVLNNNSHVYIVKRLDQEKKDEFHTLSQYEYREGSRLRTQKRYIGILRFLLEDYLAKIKDDLYQLEFDDDALLKLISDYNSFKSPKSTSTTYFYKVPAVIKKGPSISFGKMITSGSNIGSVMRPPNTRALDSRGYSLGYLWDVFKPDVSKRLSSCFGVSYFLLQYKYEDASKKMIGVSKHSLNIPLLVQANLGHFATDKSLVFFNIGPVFDVGTNNQFDKLNVKPHIGIGAGAYHHNFRYSLSVDNSSFLLKDDKYVRLSVSFLQKRKLKDKEK